MKSEEIIFETSRLYHRKVTLEDVDDFFELDSNPRVHQYLGNNPIKNREQSKGYILGLLEQYEAYGIGRLAVILKETGEFLGWSSIKYETSIRDYNYYDIGYRFKEQYWGRGYAKESATAALEWGFETLRLNKICGAADIGNVASNKILKGIGLKYTETFVFEGDPHYWYELSKENYRKQASL